MKLSRINIDGNCLSSDVVSIALHCITLHWLGLLLELATPKPEISCSILVDSDPSKSLAGA
jgi:hypothetical protein